MSAREVKPQELTLPLSDFRCSLRDVDAETSRRGKLAQNRAQQSAGADPEIKDPQRVPAPLGEERNSGFDDRLRFRAGIQNVRRNAERQTPKLALSHDPRQRLGRRAARGEGIETARTRRRAATSGAAIRAAGETPQRGAEQEPRLAAGLFQRRVLKPFGQLGERLGPGRRGAEAASLKRPDRGSA